MILKELIKAFFKKPLITHRIICECPPLGMTKFIVADAKERVPVIWPCTIMEYIELPAIGRWYTCNKDHGKAKEI